MFNILLVFGLCFFCEVLFCIFSKQTVFGGFDGIIHLTSFQAYISSFSNMQGAANISSLARFFGDQNLSQGYQGFYWFYGCIGAIFHLSGFQTVQVAIASTPFIGTICAWVGFTSIRSKISRLALALLYGTSPMMMGLCLWGSSWPMAFSAALLPLVLRGAIDILETGRVFLFAMVFSILCLVHPLTALLSLIAWIPLIAMSVRIRSGQRFQIICKGLVAGSVVAFSQSYLIVRALNTSSRAYTQMNMGVESVSMNNFGYLESASRFAQKFSWPDLNPSYSFGLTGTIPIFILGITLAWLQVDKRLRNYEWKFKSFFLFSWALATSVIYTLILLPLPQIQLQLKLLLHPWIPMIGYFFPSRFLPLALLFLLFSLGLIAQTAFRLKLITAHRLNWIIGITMSLHFFQASQVLWNKVPDDLDGNSVFQDSRLTTLLYSEVSSATLDHIIKPANTISRPSGYEYLQPSLLWKWKSGDNGWNSTRWSNQPYIEFRPPFRPIKIQNGSQHQIESGIFSGTGSTFQIPVGDLGPGGYRLRISIHLDNVQLDGHAPSPFEMQLISSHPSTEAWIFPVRLDWTQKKTNTLASFEVPFQIDSSTGAAALLVKTYPGYRFSIKSIGIDALEKTPFRTIEDGDPLIFTLSENTELKNLDIVLPRLFMPGYQLTWKGLKGETHSVTPPSPSAMGTVQVTLNAEELLELIHLENPPLVLRFIPPNPLVNFRLSIFVFCILICGIIYRKESRIGNFRVEQDVG